MLPIIFRPTSRDFMFGTVATVGDKKVEILRYDTCHSQWQVFRYINKQLQHEPVDNPRAYTHPVAMQIAISFLQGNQA